MNNFLLIAKNPHTYFVKRLIEEVGSSQVHWCNPFATGEVHFSAITHVLFRSSGVYHDDADLKLARTFTVPIFNPLFSLETFRSKSGQYHFFQQHHLPVLDWCWGKEIPRFVAQKYLIKPDYGQGGWGIEVFDQADLMEWQKKKLQDNDFSWIIQPYLAQVHEYRVFFIQDHWITLKRSSDEVAADFSQNGKAQLVELPQEFQSMIAKLITLSGAYYGAIDFLVGPKGPYLLELNTVPGIEQLEQVSRQNILQLFLTRLPTP